MRSHDDSSTSRRVLVGVIVVGFLVLFNVALFGWLIFRSLSEQELSRIMSQTRAEAEDLAAQLAGEVDRGGEDLLSAILRKQETQTYIDRVLAKREEVETVRIYDREGTKIFENISERSSTAPEQPEIGDDSTVETRSFDQETAYDSVTVPPQVRELARGSYQTLEVPVGEHGSFVIGISQPEMQRRIAVLRRELLRQATPIAGVTVVILITAYILVLWLARRGRRLEGRARDAEQMAYIGTLASGLAHEIRSPLNSLNLNMQMLEEEVGGDVPRSSGRLLSITRSEITRLENLVTDFLSYARPRPLEPVEARAVDLLERVVEVLGVELDALGIAVEVADASDGGRVLVDVDQMGQLLLNLAHNAVGALDGVASPKLTLAVRPRGGELEIVVEDNGIGISEEQKGRVFDLFYSERRGGTGLGLAIAQRIARAHGTVLEIDSVVGRGTSVRMRLPALGGVPERESSRAPREPISLSPVD